jgi:16S rRNA processing protein RimM
MLRIPVGRVVSAHGLRGEVKFDYYNQAKQDFLRYTSLLAEKHGISITLEVAGVRFQKGFLYIQFAGLDSREKTSFLMGRELSVREEDLPRLNEDEYYDYQLVGLDVVNSKLEKIGKVERVFHTEAGDVLAVTGRDEHFIPMAEGSIVRIDLAAASITVNEDAILA